MLLLTALIGLLDASYLSMVHLSASKTCGAGNGCSEVLASAWAVIAGIPVAAMGVGMYLALAWFTACALRKPRSLSVNEPWMLIISAAGVLVSAFFTILQAAVIRQWCPLCLLSAGLTCAFFLICLTGVLKTGSLPSAIKQPDLLVRGLPWALLAFVLPPLLVLAAEQGRRVSGTGASIAGDRIVVGIIGAEKYTLGDVDKAIRGTLQQLDEQRYQARKAFLVEKLIALEASRENLTPQTLIRKEVVDKIPVTPDEIREFIDENRSRLPSRMSRELILRIETQIRQTKTAAARDAYVDKLRERYGAQFSVPIPKRLSMKINPRGGPVKGPIDAPVNIILFTDFECPYCRKTHQALEALMERLPGKIRLAFRHFPLSRHKWAETAAEFAFCAQRQGRFWPFADRIFALQGRLSEEILYDSAREAGIADMESFRQCLQSGQGKDAVAADIAEGKSLGVKSTPSLFINGRFFAGMPDDIDALIQEEIDISEKKGSVSDRP